jgi:hypothetical protein
MINDQRRIISAKININVVYLCLDNSIQKWTFNVSNSLRPKYNHEIVRVDTAESYTTVLAIELAFPLTL